MRKYKNNIALLRSVAKTNRPAKLFCYENTVLILVGKMQFLLTDSEIFLAVQNAKQEKDGFYRIHMPEDRLQSRLQIERLPIIGFNQSTNTITCGRNSIRLSPIQFALLEYVYNHKRVGYEELQDIVWKTSATDGAIRIALSKLNTKLLDNGVSVELVSRHSRVSLEIVA